jgi:WD40 repeat protein
MPDLFISYARGDSRDFVARLSAALEERGKDTWVDLEDIPAASVWTDDLREGIASSDSFCFVISPVSVTSEHCRTELEYAVGLGKRLLPVLHRPAPDADVPEPVAVRNWIPQTGRFADDFDGSLATLIIAIETDLDWVREHTRWGLRATEWERRGEDGSLLARGSDLDQAEAFLSGGGGKEPQPTELQGRYVLASRRAATRRQRQLVTGVSVALVVAIVLGVLALLQRNTAVEQRHEADRQRHQAETERAAATSRALAANAFLNLPTDPELSLLLGLEAAKASPTVEAETALRSGLLDSQVRLQLHHEAAVTSAEYSPDGTRIVTTSEDGNAALWDAGSGERIALLEGHSQPPEKAVWSADGSRVVTVAPDSTARVYDGGTGEPVSVITDADDPRLSDVVISADGSVVVTSGFVHNQVRFWNAADGSLLATIPRETVDAIALSPDNSLLLLAEQGQGVELWSTRDVSLVASFPEDAQSYFTSALFRSDGSAFETAGADGFATVRAVDGTFLAQVRHDATVNAAAFSPDGTQLATASEDGTAKVTEIGTGTALSTFAGHTGSVDAIAFSPSGGLVATGGQDGRVKLWRPRGATEVATLVGHQAPVNDVTFAPADGMVLSASDDSTVRIWSAAGSAAAFPVESASTVEAYNLETLSTEGRYAAVTVLGADIADPDTLETVDVASGAVRGQFTLEQGTALPALSPDGQFVVTAGPATSLRRTSDGSLVADLAVTGPHDAAFDNAGKRVLVVGDEGQAGIYDTESGELVVGLEGHDPAHEVVGAAFSKDGSRALTASVDGTARVWDADTGEQLLEVKAFGPPAGGMYEQYATVALSPDGDVLATAAGYEADAELWDAHTGSHLATLEGVKNGDLKDLGFSDDGRFVVTAPLHGAVRLWDGHSGRLLASVTDPDVDAGAVTFIDHSKIALIGSLNGQESVGVLDCTVCGDLDSLVALAKTRVTRELTDTEKATYLSGD